MTAQILMSPTAFWPVETAPIRQRVAARFNALAHTAGMQMGAHDRALGITCNPDNWPYQCHKNETRRACFEAGYYMGYREMGL